MQIPGPAPVVVGVNGTAAGLAAVRLGAREAMARGQPLRILHVFAWPSTRHFDDAPDWATARHRASEIVEDAVATASRTVPGVRVQGLLIDGSPVRELLRQSRTAELLVLGDDDVALSPRLPPDCVLVQTVSRSRCPVLVARGIRPPAGPLLAAVDGSECSLLALRHVAAEARRREIAVEVVHVVERCADQEKGRRVLAAAMAAVPGLAGARGRLLIGEPAPTLVRASRRARMMMVGPRGAGGSSLLGSVAQQLLRRCACPTLFVHGTPAEDPAVTGTVPQAGALIS